MSASFDSSGIKDGNMLVNLQQFVFIFIVFVVFLIFLIFCRIVCRRYKDKIKENNDKIKLNKQLPYLVANVVELLDTHASNEQHQGRAVGVAPKL